LRILEVEVIKWVTFVPVSHPFVERLIGTIRQEFLDYVLIWNAIDLERKLEEFSWKSSENTTTKIAFTSRSVAALRENDLANRRPTIRSLITMLGGTIAAVCSRCQSQHNYEFAMDRLIWLFSRPAAYRKGCSGDPGELAGRDRRRSTGQYHSPLHHGEHPLR